MNHNANSLLKITISHTSGRYSSKDWDILAKHFTVLTGQKPIKTYAKKGIAPWSVRVGFITGLKVTLRKEYMSAFIHKMAKYALLREKSFVGFDHRGIIPTVFNGGIRDISIFPETSDLFMGKPIGFHFSIVSNCKTIEEKINLLKSVYNIPFINKKI